MNDAAEPAGLRRPAADVMRLARLGSAHQTRLSFMRSLLRRLRREGWQFDRPVWQIDGHGVGCAVYRAIGPTHSYSLVAFAHDLPDEQRSDRVIATAWDATFTLFDGEPDADDLARLADNVPRQEAGRISDSELCLARANRSVRLWNDVVASLARGVQPDPDEIDKVGYLMRTTAVYGSGKFGAADRSALLGRPMMRAPFHVEMLAVWLIRAFTLDLVEHMAAAAGGPGAVRLDPMLRRRFGVGNSTGLGMAPFLVNHPALLHAWIDARETAIARVRAVQRASAAAQSAFATCLTRAQSNATLWQTADPTQSVRCAVLRRDLDAAEQHIRAGALEGPDPWDALMRWAESRLSLEGQEQIAALMLEPYGDLVDDLSDAMEADEQEAFRIDGAMQVARLRDLIARNYAWALAPDYADPAQSALFWYVSAEKLEPRLGLRHEEAGAEVEQPLDVGRCVAALAACLAAWDTPEAPLARVLRAHPEHRHAVRRVQLSATRPYAEIRDNMIGADLLPIDLMRCKLAFFGATRFDPRSDRWVRICMFQNAPFPHEIGDVGARAEQGEGLCPLDPGRATARPGVGGNAPDPIPGGPGTLSLSEIDALCRKAARGSGCPWGMAEEAGKAARWLSAHGLPGPEALAALLGASRNCRCTGTTPAPGCALALGAELSDDAAAILDQGGRAFGTVAQPLLLLAQAGQSAAALGVALTIEWTGFRAICAPHGLSLEQAAARDIAVATDVACRIGPVPAISRAAETRARPVATAALAALEALAAKTYAPASEASRARGAGAANLDKE